MVKEHMFRIGFIGCGKMAQALAKGFIAGGVTKAENIIGSSPRIDSVFIDEFASLGCATTHENVSVVESSEVIVLATKPPLIPKVLTEINPVVDPRHLVISIAMGIPIFSLEQEVPETLIDSCTGLSGSGPAYMYIAMEALADGGVRMGIPRELAYKLSAHTLIGAARMVLETGRHPGALKDDVCSPAGSTIQAVYYLEKSGLRASLMEAVQAATMKSKQTGRKE